MPKSLAETFDELSVAGHDLTLTQGVLAGVSTYYCEGCGAFVQVGAEELVVFHVPRGTRATKERCVVMTADEGPTLRAKLEAQRARRWAALRAAAEE